MRLSQTVKIMCFAFALEKKQKQKIEEQKFSADSSASQNIILIGRLMCDVIMLFLFAANGSVRGRRFEADVAWIAAALRQAEGQREEQEALRTPRRTRV